MAEERFPILVHGATGFTGRLVCAALVERGLPFAMSGRNRERLEKLRDELALPSEVAVVDVSSGDAVRAAVAGRRIVLACAGPFVDVGEPILAACAKLGVHYADTTGEQRFVADAVHRYQATCEASGACLVPSMAYETAPADWVSHLAADAVGGSPDAIDIVYAAGFGVSGYGSATTRGTKKSAARMFVESEPLAFVEGDLRVEPAAEIVRSFDLPIDGGTREVRAASFPSPEALLVPKHTGARTVRSFLAVPGLAARALHRVRRFAPSIVRPVLPIVDRVVDRGRAGPDGALREARFVIAAEARKGGVCARVAIRGSDPYGTTAKLQAYAAERVLAGAVSARGVVGASVAFLPRDGIAALGFDLVEDSVRG